MEYNQSINQLLLLSRSALVEEQVGKRHLIISGIEQVRLRSRVILRISRDETDG